MKKLKIDVKKIGTDFEYLRGQKIDKAVIKNWRYLSPEDLEYLITCILSPMLDVSGGSIVLKGRK